MNQRVAKLRDVAVGRFVRVDAERSDDSIVALRDRNRLAPRRLARPDGEDPRDTGLARTLDQHVRGLRTRI
jgi:hypothetical protein